MIFLPIAVLSMVGAAGVAQTVRSKRKSSAQTAAERKVIYETALNSVKDSEKLRKLAAVFRKEGLPAEADMLEKRAALQDLPADVKQARRDAFRKGMTSTDVPKIMALADAFHAEGATGAAENLRKYAAGLAGVAREETDA